MKKKLIDFPADQLDPVYPEIEKHISAFFEAQVKEETGRYKELLSKYKEHYEKYVEKIAGTTNPDHLSLFFYENANLRNQILQLLESLFTEHSEDDLDQTITALISECLEALEPLPEFYYARQQEPRFTPAKQDPRWNRFIKKNKRMLRGLHRGVVRVYNFPVKLFGMKPIEVHWKHKVLLRKIVHTHFILNNIQLQNRTLSNFYSGISSIYLNLWKADALINQKIQDFFASDHDIGAFKEQLSALSLVDEIEKSGKQLDEILGDFKKSVKQNHASSKESIVQNCDICGTFEKKQSHYDKGKIERLSQKASKEVIHTKKTWNNTFYILTEDWKLDLEVYSLSCLTYKSFFDFTTTVNSRLTQELKLKITDFTKIVGESQDIFEKIKSDETTDLVKGVTQLKLDIKRKLLLKLVPSINELILEAKIPEYFDSIEQLIRSQFDKLSKQRYLLKSSQYDKPISLSEAESISPYSLVTFEMMPRFLQVFPAIKNSYINFISVLQNDIEEIPEILDFSLDSTLTFYEGNKNKEEALKISAEGFMRVDKKSDEIHNRLIEAIANARNQLKTAIDEFMLEFLKVTDNENALQIKFRITKAKAIEKAKAIRTEIITKIKNLIPVILSKVKLAIDILKVSSQKLIKQLAESDEQKFVSTEVSDYLTETLEAINKLPFIYQRLFKIEPLESFELFIERQEPIEKLKLAFDKWKDGKFAPVVVIGEKGCGKTSLISKYKSLYLPAEQVLHIDLHLKPHQPELLFNEIKDAAGEKPQGEGQIAFSSKKIIVIDGLEKLFLMNVDGFEYLKKTFQLISDTNSYIFWIYTCHQYSWEYLDRCISSSDFFAYHIKLKDITDEILKKIIKKRNSVSGYNLVFNPPIQEKTFSLIPKKKRVPEQAELESLYFSQLNNVTGGNITIALLYWMRSTAKVTEDTIYINSLSNLNLQFVKSISKSKLTTIRSLIIHNGLNVKEYAHLFRISEEESSYILNQLLNDGILHISQENYLVNPLIYSQVVNYMKQLNLLS